jgi:hypothetical protein
VAHRLLDIYGGVVSQLHTEWDDKIAPAKVCSAQQTLFVRHAAFNVAQHPHNQVQSPAGAMCCK